MYALINICFWKVKKEEKQINGFIDVSEYAYFQMSY